MTICQKKMPRASALSHEGHCFWFMKNTMEYRENAGYKFTMDK